MSRLSYTQSGHFLIHGLLSILQIIVCLFVLFLLVSAFADLLLIPLIIHVVSSFFFLTQSNI
jgi:cellulose synthase/poly-beta-1,6-N-acetylglucosamine synthase-like glycosyltransferase